MRNAFGRLFRAILQARVDRESHIGDFVNRRGHGRDFLEAVAGTERLQFVGVDRVHYTVEQFAELGVAIEVVAALEHPVHGIVEVAAGGIQMSGLEVLLARFELGLDSGDKGRLVVLIGLQQGNWRRIAARPERERRQRLRARGTGRCGVGFRGCRLRRLRLRCVRLQSGNAGGDRFLRTVVAACGHRGNEYNGEQR